MARRKLIIGGALLLVVLVGAAVFGATRFSNPSGAYRLVDETTLAVLRGEVQLQRAEGSFGSVTTDMTVRPGDRIRTGPDAYGTLTFFDGSSTTLEPNTEIVVRRLDDLGGGGANISVAQQIGQTWNRVERLIGSSSRFETTTNAAVAFVRGTSYRVRVEPSQLTIVEAMEGTVFVEGAGVTVILQAGFMTTIRPGEAPSPPVAFGLSGHAVQIDVSGPARLFLVDDLGRSDGLHPIANGMASQIPGLLRSVQPGRSTIVIPGPSTEYELIISPDGSGGVYSIAVTDLVDGCPSPSTGARPEMLLTGSVAPGQHHVTSFQVLNGQVAGPRQPPVPGDGQPSRGRVILARRGPPSGATSPDAEPVVLPTAASSTAIGAPAASAGQIMSLTAFGPCPEAGAPSGTRPTLGPTTTPAPGGLTPRLTVRPTVPPRTALSEAPITASTATPDPATALPTAVSEPPSPTSTATPDPTTVVPTATPQPTVLPTSVTGPPPSTVTPTPLEASLFELINRTRQGRDVQVLVWEPNLAEVAREHTRDMAERGYFDHISLEGEDPSARMLKGGVLAYRPGVFWGENLSIDETVEQAHARDLAEDLVPGGHHTNIVDPRFTRVGIGIAELPGHLLITVLFLP